MSTPSRKRRADDGLGAADGLGADDEPARPSAVSCNGAPAHPPAAGSRQRIVGSRDFRAPQAEPEGGSGVNFII